MFYIGLIIGIIIGGISGAYIAYSQIKRYREALGLPKDPFEPNVQYFL